jgi:putative tricarboxylic transport membrane protein
LFEFLLAGFHTAFSLSGMGYAFLGAAFGYLFGFLPGLTGSVALSLLIPITFGMESTSAMMMLAGTLGGVCFGGSVTAILINAPGTGSNAATALDGYALSQKGRAGEALGASALSSFLGHFIGIAILVASVPIMTKMVLAFGPAEWFSLGLGGLFLIATVSGGSLINGVIAGCLGLLLSTHGINVVVGGQRFTFGQMWLWDGLPLIPVIVGIMALSEMISLFGQSRSISMSGTVNRGGTLKGMKAVLKNLKLVGIGGTIGVLIGAIPGVGGNISSWLSLSVAKQLSKSPETFGKGNIEGVIAPEAANDATEGGALIPLVSLGIPGSPSTAVLLGALIMHGLQPGQKMLTQQLDVVFALSFAHLFGAFIACSIGLTLAKHLAKITTIPSKLLVPVLSIICLAGAYSSRMRMSDVYLAIFFGLVGFFMKKCNVPRVPVLLGLILGQLIELSFQTTMQISGNSLLIFFTRPYSLVFMMFIPISLGISFVMKNRKKKEMVTPAP